MTKHSRPGDATAALRALDAQLIGATGALLTGARSVRHGALRRAIRAAGHALFWAAVFAAGALLVALVIGYGAR